MLPCSACILDEHLEIGHCIGGEGATISYEVSQDTLAAVVNLSAATRLTSQNASE